MYAIVDIAGQQFKVEKDQKLYVHRLEGEEGKKVSFDQVLLIDTGSKVTVGDPVVKGAAVSARILAHLKSDKVLVFKKKRKKGYQKLNGHRQYMTHIQIEAISEKSVPKPADTETAAAKPAPARKETTTTKKEVPAAKTTAAKTTAAKAATAKKPAAKKPAAKPTPKKESDKK